MLNWFVGDFLSPETIDVPIQHVGFPVKMCSSQNQSMGTSECFHSSSKPAESLRSTSFISAVSMNNVGMELKHDAWLGYGSKLYYLVAAGFLTIGLRNLEKNNQ